MGPDPYKLSFAAMIALIESSPDGRQAIVTAIDKMAPGDQRVLHLRAEDGMRFREIAVAMGWTERDVHASYKRSMRVLSDVIVNDLRPKGKS